jgi:hypothetical protein
MTLEKVQGLPPITRTGSGRNSNIFTPNVMTELRNDRGTWAIVSKSDYIDCSHEQGKSELKTLRLQSYMKGRYARKTNNDIEATVRTERHENAIGFKRIVLYARSI